MNTSSLSALQRRPTLALNGGARARVVTVRAAQGATTRRAVSLGVLGTLVFGGGRAHAEEDSALIQVRDEGTVSLPSMRACAVRTAARETKP